MAIVSNTEYKMIGLKALLVLLVVGQLSLSTAGIRHRPHHDGDTRVDNKGNSDQEVQELLNLIEIGEKLETLKNLLKTHRDASVPARQLPISNQKSHEVGQYILIVRNTAEKLINTFKKTNKWMDPEKALKDTFNDSMREYTEDYKVKIQPAIDMVTHVHNVLKPVFKLANDLLRETDPSQQLAIYSKYRFDNKLIDDNEIFMLSHVQDFLEAVNSGPVAEENILVEEGAGRYVTLNWSDTANIALIACQIGQSDPTRPTHS